MKLTAWMIGTILCGYCSVTVYSDKISLKSGTNLLFYKDKLTSSHRTDAIPQLKSAQGVDVLESMLCTALVGQDERKFLWKCDSHSCNTNKVLGEVYINCEGYESSEDASILINSCGLTYNLSEVKEEEHKVWSAVSMATVSYSFYEAGKMIGKWLTGTSNILVENPLEFAQAVAKNFLNDPKKWTHAAKLGGNAAFVAEKFKKGGLTLGPCSGYAYTTYR